MDSEKPDPQKPGTGHRRWRRAMVASSVLGAMLFSGGAILPTALLKTSYRDSLLNSKLEKHGLTAKSESGSGSWITPLVLQNLVLTDEKGHVHLEVETIRVSSSLLTILTTGDLGTVSIIEPAAVITLDDNGKLPLKKPDSATSDSKFDMDFDIQNADLEIAVPWRPLPIVSVTDVDVSGDITNDESGYWLSIDPVNVYDHEPLSQAHTEQNLALIAPVLSQSTELEGEVSVTMDAARFQLDKESLQPFPIKGQAIFHSVTTRLKKDWAIQVAGMLNRATQGRVLNRLQIARDSAVAFEVDDRGIHHHGLAFLLPDIAAGMTIESSGMVGLDESLDLAFAVQLPSVVARNPLTAAFSRMVSAPFQMQVKGTIDKPKLITPPGFSLVDQLSLNNDPANFSPEAKPVGGAVMDLINGVAQPNRNQTVEGLPGSILEIIRSAKQAREAAGPREKRPKKRPKRRK